ncbi:hypothetical protein [Extensimonas sp. H3M7-6]|uniref:hypothetical protein n=1 Tax=Extensimonas soli TaxID=3031322 RepID=UPI0023DBC715|nr:hypothetical protein [Extensimonas sp. H3M7-6]MDF1482770.1 hypothetical protein [Extensimonas sp. H3M7-6]
MQTMPPPSEEPKVEVPVMAAAEIQDALLVVMHDLRRLEGLLDHATEVLLARFHEANALLSVEAVTASPALAAVREALRGAVTELQFHDMAVQLITHTQKVLQGCAFRLAAEVIPPEEGEDAASCAPRLPERPNPVTQGEMDAGSVELF